MIGFNNIIASIKFEEKTSVKVVDENSEFNVWVDVLFNQDIYETTLVTDLSFVKVSEYQYTVTADNLEFNTIEMVLSNKDKSKQKTSNTLVAVVK